MRFASLVLFLALGSLVSAQEKPDSPKPNDSYYTPESFCRGGYHKTDWHDFGFPYYTECAKDNQATNKSYSITRPANKWFWVGSAAMGASSTAPWIGGNICRSNNGVEPCTEHYGSYNAWNGLITGASVFAAPAVFYGCRKEYQNSKWCWAIPAIVIAGNVGWGIHEARIDKPEIAGQSVIRRRDLNGKR